MSRPKRAADRASTIDAGTGDHLAELAVEADSGSSKSWAEACDEVCSGQRVDKVLATHIVDGTERRRVVGVAQAFAALDDRRTDRV